MAKYIRIRPIAEGPLHVPDPENRNRERSEWAAGAISTFCQLTGADPEDAMADLLCDLMHYADRHTDLACGSFPTALKRARQHYREETEYRGTQAANFD